MLLALKNGRHCLEREHKEKREMSNQVVRVKRGAIAACMTCPLCDKLLRDATTISECLHTFCRKCIYNKLSEEELDCCPICNIDLGCVPLEKLRPDHSLQDVREKIFPSKRRKINPAEVVSSVALPARIKERSLSSLVVSTPRVSTQTALTGRRSKVSVRKTLRGSSFSIEKQIKKVEDSEEDPESSSSRETLTKYTTIRQNSSIVDQSSHAKPDIETENAADPWEEKVNLWKPLDCLAEVANRSKSSKFTSQGSASKSEPTNNAPKVEGLSRKTKQKPKVQDEKDSTDLGPAESEKLKKLRRLRQKKSATFGESGVSPQAVLDATRFRRERKLNQIWCSLVASEDREGYGPLPQISASFLRIKDGSASVSSVQKYLMKKLDLPSEDEVEIRCMGQPVMPTLQLHSLVELWLQTVSATSERASATIGSSATEFVMVLGYARKVPSP